MTVNMGGAGDPDGYLYGTNGNWRCLCLEPNHRQHHV